MAEPALAGATGIGASRSDSVTRLFGSRIYFRLWCSQVVSSPGDWVGLIAVTAVAARVGGGNSGAAVGLVLSARVVPGLFLGSLIWVAALRRDRKRTMVGCDVGRGLVLLWLGGPVIVGAGWLSRRALRTANVPESVAQG